jgi:glycerophosphoryl diester phosphodiesterase
MKKNPGWLKAKPFAHRGLFGEAAPENSMPAIHEAAALGFPIEIDVQAGSDGRIFVFHDRCLERLTGHRAMLADLPWEILSTLRLEGFEAGIPLLEDVLQAVGGRVGLLIEIKSAGRPWVAESATAALLDQYPGDFAIQSFNPGTLLWFKKMRPHVLRGQISYGYRSEAPWKRFLLANYGLNGITRPDFIADDWQRLPAWAPMAIKRFQRLPLLGWTVRSQVEHDRCLSWTDNTIFEGFVPT